LMIAYFSTTKKWYAVRWNEELKAFICTFEYSAVSSCIHIFAADACIRAGEENLAMTIGGGFLGGILIGYTLKKIVKIAAIIAGFLLAALAYLQYQQIANINWDRLQIISEDTLTTLANATQQIPGFDGTSNGNVSPELVMTNLGIPLTGSFAIGFTIGFMRG
jgi:uncharacterized membrane protein (Fun14 family)